jgi:cellulose synthase/poly-beta-1,6-N-acetylglucosamine synthase-like glycosyltransferase
MLPWIGICAALLAYTYVGYPLLLGALAARFGRRPARDPSWEPTVTVCIAAYDAAATIETKLASVASQQHPTDKLEILVYSDGSTDETDAIVARFAARDSRVRLIRGERRMGKPTALNRMRDAAKGEVLLLTDSRQPLAPGALRALLDQLADPTVGCVTGNLVLQGETGAGVYWRYENWMRRQESRLRSVVGMTGPIAALRKVDLDPLPRTLILDDVWIPMRLRLRGRSVLLADDAIAYDQAFADEREFRRKVRTLAGNYQVFALMPKLLVPFVNPSWFETVSHKLLRLVCPWALVGLFAASLVGALDPARHGPELWLCQALVVAQLAFYVAALAGPFAGRVAGVARTFVVLNAAAVVGLYRFLTGRQPVTW